MSAACRMIGAFLLVCGFCCLSLPAGARQHPEHFIVLSPGTPADSIVARATRIVPTPDQYAWQRNECIAFLHFGMNTFTNREWGDGMEDPALFQPTDLDARQWIGVLKKAGFTMAILTAKHHDGFCLWPSRYTDHSVAHSPWRGGRGDLVREVADACREAGMKFGVYLSPWDRHEPSYGDSVRYNEFFRNQLTELLTGYGDIAEVWFDGANGEGPGGKKQWYDWASYYKLIRELQPHAVIFGMGPDVRWVGTESGDGRETEWSVVPLALHRTAAASAPGHPLDGLFIPKDIMGEDLGGRNAIAGAEALAWYPAEADVSIRPGWFYHPEEDGRVKSPETLVDIYDHSAGRNAMLLINIPPDRRGRIAGVDSASLVGMRAILEGTFARNLLSDAQLRSSSEQAGHPASFIADGSADTYWAARDGEEKAVIDCTLPEERSFDCLVLQEEIPNGQRIESFRLEAWTGDAWAVTASGTTVGHKRIVRFQETSARKLRLVIAGSRGTPALAEVGFFKAPPAVTIRPEGGAFVESVRVILASEARGVLIRYTLDGSPPTPSSTRYDSPLTLFDDALIAARAYAASGPEGIVHAARFHKVSMGLALHTAFSPRYSGGGPLALIDGERGTIDPGDGHWQGYEGDDLDAVLDLGETKEVAGVSAGFLRKTDSWIFLPDSVAFSASDDGRYFRPVAVARDSAAGHEAGPLVRPFATACAPFSCRYVRVRAHNIGVCPPWHPGAGKKAWLFVDEITILPR